MRTLVAGAWLALTLLSAQSAMAQTIVEPRALDATYSVSAKGITAGEFTYQLTLADGGYSASASRRMTGLVRSLVGNAQDYSYSSRGQATASGLRPVAYEHSGGKKGRVVKVAFAGGEPTTTAVPSLGMGDPPATRAQKQGAVDQLTAIAALVTGGENPCQGTIKVLLDGRSRFDFVMASTGMVTARTRAYQGPALQCRVEYRPIAGFSDPQQATTLTFLFARDPAGVNVPIRIEMPTDDVGIATLEIKKFGVR